VRVDHLGGKRVVVVEPNRLEVGDVAEKRALHRRLLVGKLEFLGAEMTTEGREAGMKEEMA